MARATGREPLSRERILDAALGLIDAEGVEAVTMRAVAARLGVEAMSLYRHVGSKEALLDGVVERVLATRPERRGAKVARGWRRGLRAEARALRSALAAHPAVVPLFVQRALATPGALRQLEQALEPLRQAGLGPAQALAVFHLVAAFVVGHSALTIGVRASAGLDYEALDEGQFPRVREAARALAARDVEGEFEQGLRALLRGLPRSLRPLRAQG